MRDFWSWIRQRRAGPKAPGALVLDSLSDDRLGDLLGSLLFTSLKWRKLRRFAFGSAEADFIGEEERTSGSPWIWWAKVLRPNWNGVLRPSVVVRNLLRVRGTEPDVLLLLTTTDVDPDEAAGWVRAAETEGVRRTLVWSRRDLELRLRRDRPDLVFAYFGAAPVRTLRSSARVIHRKLDIKHRVLDALILRPDERPVALHPFDKFRYSHVIVRSMRDELYPESAAVLGEPTGWYRLATYDALHDGLELLLGTELLRNEAVGTRRESKTPEEKNAQTYTFSRVLRIGKLPYERILDFDVDGDEYYPLPHLYCDFSGGNSLFTEIRYQPVGLILRESLGGRNASRVQDEGRPPSGRLA